MDILKLIEETKILQERPQSYSKFLGISAVVVNERIFVRIGENHLYKAFLKDQKGKIKINKQIFQANVLVPDDIKKITSKINSAYYKKYSYGKEIINLMGNKPSPIFYVVEFNLIK
jgi:hypothetical protein